MLLSALGSHNEPGLLIATARCGVLINVWVQALDGSSRAGEGWRRAAAPNDMLHPIHWERRHSVRESPANSGGSSQLACHSDVLPQKQFPRPADSQTVLDSLLSTWFASFGGEK